MANILLGDLPTYTGNTSNVWIPINDSGNTTTYKVSRQNLVNSGMTQAPIGIAASDEVSLLNIGLKYTFRMPTAFTLTKVKSSLTQAPSGSTLTVDVKNNGSSIFSTLLTIDSGETTSETANVPAVLSTTNFSNDDEITIYITQIGSISAGRGLKLWFI
jgi:uncharacterized protein YdgA (DUF945 family)